MAVTVSKQELKRELERRKGQGNLQKLQLQRSQLQEELKKRQQVGPEGIIRGAGEFAGKAALETILFGLEVLDHFTGAPARQAVFTTIQETNSGKSAVEALASGFKAGAKRLFGMEEGEPPQGADIAQQLGMTESSLSDLVPGIFSKTGEGAPLKKGGIFDLTAQEVAGIPIDMFLTLPVGTAFGVAKRVAGKGGQEAKRIAKGTVDLLGGVEKGAVGSEVIGATSRGLGEFAEGASAALNPKTRPKFEKLLNTARELGVPDEALDDAIIFGKGSFLSRKGRQLRESQLGQERIRKLGESVGITQVKTEELIERLTGVADRFDAAKAGSELRAAYEGARRNLFENAEVMRGNVDDLIRSQGLPDQLFPSVKNKINKIADKHIRKQARRADFSTPSTKGAAENMLKTLDVAKGINSQSDLAVFLDALGDDAFDKIFKGQIPQDKRVLREFYREMADVEIDNVKAVLGPEIAEQLSANNKKISDFFNNREVSRKMADPQLSDEKLFNQLILNSDSKKISSLEEILPPEEMNKMRKAFIDVKAPIQEGEELADSLVDVRKLGDLSRLIKSKRNDSFKALFKDSAQELEDAIELAGEFSDVFLSSSGTGGSVNMSFLNTLREGFDSAVLENVRSRALRTSGAGELLDIPSRLPSPAARTGRRAVEIAQDPRAQRIGRGIVGQEDRLREAQQEGFDIVAKTMDALNKSFKIPRSFAGIQENQDIISAKLRMIDPNLAKQFSDDMKFNPEAVKKMVPQLLQMGPQFFEQADFNSEFDMDGQVRLYDPIDQKAFRDSILNDLSIPPVEKAKTINDLNTHGVIPLSTVKKGPVQEQLEEMNRLKTPVDPQLTGEVDRIMLNEEPIPLAPESATIMPGDITQEAEEIMQVKPGEIEEPEEADVFLGPTETRFVPQGS